MCSALFDQYAPKFEAALVDDLGYRGPALLFKAVLSARAAVRKPAFFRRAIDLGCGTGLAATRLRRANRRFIGIDLSPRMIELARLTGLYAELEVAEIVEGLAQQARRQRRSDPRRRRRWSMSPILRRCCARPRACWRRAGWWPSPSKPMPAKGCVLGEGLRYAQGAGYVRGSVEAAGLALDQLEAASSRNESGVAVPGLVAVATKDLRGSWPA